ncbi:MAG: OsmC family peroxiredoxin [Anaerolineae bacterium]|nr:OsmC family peroxiredoxin [Anaerolineae bacterium]
MAIRHANAKWSGTLKEGNGVMKFGDYEGPFTHGSRFEEGEGTNPEELVGAAHAGCFSMFLSALLTGDDHPPKTIETKATVHLGEEGGGPKITHIDLDCEADVPGIDQDSLNTYADKAKKNCPISRLFTGTQINLTVKLI